MIQLTMPGGTTPYFGLDAPLPIPISGPPILVKQDVNLSSRPNVVTTHLGAF